MSKSNLPDRNSEKTKSTKLTDTPIQNDVTPKSKSSKICDELSLFEINMLSQAGTRLRTIRQSAAAFDCEIKLCNDDDSSVETMSWNDFYTNIKPGNLFEKRKTLSLEENEKLEKKDSCVLF